jgi:hypothetical protein
MLEKVMDFKASASRPVVRDIASNWERLKPRRDAAK